MKATISPPYTLFVAFLRMQLEFPRGSFPSVETRVEGTGNEKNGTRKSEHLFRI